MLISILLSVFLVYSTFLISIQLHKIISWCSKTNYLQARHFGVLGQEASFIGQLPLIVNDIVKASISPTPVVFPGRAPPTLMVYLPGKICLSLSSPTRDIM